jgi:hypothetical protein
MATRSIIARQNPDGSLDAIYCHWDGYPDHNGKILKEHYRSAEKVDALIALGNLSGLGNEIGEKTSFATDSTDQCIAYGRDRGDEHQEATHCDSYADLVELCNDYAIGYLYLFKDNIWFWAKREQCGADSFTLVGAL